MLLAREGLSVLLVDGAPHGSDTVSTLALMRAGVLQLHHWGLLEKDKPDSMKTLRPLLTAK